MRTAARSAGYATLLVATFATAWAAGALTGPPATGQAAAHTTAPTTAPTTAATTAPTPPPAAPSTAPAVPVPTAPPAPVAEVGPTVPTRVAEVDGYQVRLDGDLSVTAPAQVFVTVTRGGAPVTDLEPVGGAFGRLVVTRVGDLAPAHVHPDATPPAPADRAGPGIAFTAEVPGSGAYRLVLEFRHAGALHTAAFALAAG